MPSVGPELPPHLAKRKRSEEALDIIQDPPKRQRSSSPHPHPTNSRRVIGPAALPAPLSERPATPPTPDTPSSDSDDDFGPSLPPPPGSLNQETERMRQEALAADTAAQEAAKKPHREEWMLLPPKQDDWSARADPTKLKNRKFNTGKGAKAPGQKGTAENALWTETPEQKRQRLADEVMGVKKPAQLGPEDKMDKWKEEEARETGRRIREYNEKNRNTSLYNEHAKAGPKEKEDDPSKRAFDREKDMGMGVKIGHKQKREMMSKAKDFGTRFEKGRYL
ncbi:hypothetical protein BDR22DRAFT_856826 [Usnea florida]